MNKFGHRNLNFMVFEYFDVILEYLDSEIIRQLKVKPRLNLSIESRVEFFGLFTKLKESYDDGKVSFSNLNFFMTDDFIFDFSNWENFYPNSTIAILFDKFFDQVNFNGNNFHPIISQYRFQLLKTSNGVSSYDAEIDANNGLDILILKLQKDGSLIFNDYVAPNDLSSKVIYSQNSFKEKIKYEFIGNGNLPSACASLGIDQILKSKKIFLVGYGYEISNIVQKMFYSKDYDKNVPVCLLKNHPNVTLLLDKEASQGIFKPSTTSYVSNYPTTNIAPQQYQTTQQPTPQPQNVIYTQQVVLQQEPVSQDNYNEVVYVDPAVVVDESYQEPQVQEEQIANNQPTVLVEYSNPTDEDNEVVNSDFDTFEVSDDLDIEE